MSAFGDIEADVLSGRSLLWLAWDSSAIKSAAATVLINTEAGRVCIITACGGRDMKCWLPLIDGIEAYASDEGCTRVRIYGRKGWLRVLEGYRQKHVIMDKELMSVTEADARKDELNPSAASTAPSMQSLPGQR
ncbi:hypothetical protein JQ604_30890 [Bradyrhizobium jicamae]|uniref:hypothetical protein n=1 Tax=Bradyrhizobium jicamae TaxID=280332 RepID=UPI001BADFEE9|nr:hypothetical protein [Bradyrhizobium jicamae]MBR0756606.1 hypothetical protein [Bradyrhizobium jicamae]